MSDYRRRAINQGKHYKNEKAWSGIDHHVKNVGDLSVEWVLVDVSSPQGFPPDHPTAESSTLQQRIRAPEPLNRQGIQEVILSQRHPLM